MFKGVIQQWLFDFGRDSLKLVLTLFPTQKDFSIGFLTISKK